MTTPQRQYTEQQQRIFYEFFTREVPHYLAPHDIAHLATLLSYYTTPHKAVNFIFAKIPNIPKLLPTEIAPTPVSPTTTHPTKRKIIVQ